MTLAHQEAPAEARTGLAERVTTILETLLSSTTRLRLDEIMTSTGLPRSTASRLLTQLEGLGWVEHDREGFTAGPRYRLLTGGSAAGTNHVHVRGTITTTLNELHAATGAVAHFSVLEGSTVLYLDKIGGAAAKQVPSRVGATYRSDLTVSGRAILACLSPERVDALFNPMRSEHNSDRMLSHLHVELVRIRGRRGVALDDFNPCSLPLRSIAVPVMGPDSVLGALSLAGPHPFSAEKAAPLLMYAARTTITGPTQQSGKPHQSPD